MAAESVTFPGGANVGAMNSVSDRSDTLSIEAVALHNSPSDVHAFSTNQDGSNNHS